MSNADKPYPALEASIVADPARFGLTLENADERRAILSISELGAFLTQDLAPILPSRLRTQAQGFFNRHPEGLKQLFIKLSDEEARLGDHSHAPIAEGGMGEECFLFTHIPADSSVNVEQYELGRSTGKISYDIPAGTLVVNRPDEYHTFRIAGPVGFVQVTESPDFIPQDLRPFNEENATPEDLRAVLGIKL